MAHRYGQGIGRIQVLGNNFYAKGTLYNERDLLFRSGPIAAYCHFCLSGSIFVNRYSPLTGRNDGGSLSPAKFEDYLGILCIKRSLYRQIVGAVELYQCIHFLVNELQLGIGAVYFPQIEHSHIYKLRDAAFIYTHDPETKYVGSGINA